MTDNKWLRNSFVWVIIMVAMLVLFFTFVTNRPDNREIAISRVIEDVKAGKITEIKAQEDSNTITVCYGDCKTGTQYTSQMPSNTNIYELLKNAGVTDEQSKGLTIDVQKAAAWATTLACWASFCPRWCWWPPSCL